MANAGELIIDNKLLKEIQSIDKALKSISANANLALPSVEKLFNKFRNKRK